MLNRALGCHGGCPGPSPRRQGASGAARRRLCRIVCANTVFTVYSCISITLLFNNIDSYLLCVLRLFSIDPHQNPPQVDGPVCSSCVCDVLGDFLLAGVPHLTAAFAVLPQAAISRPCVRAHTPILTAPHPLSYTPYCDMRRDLIYRAAPRLMPVCRVAPVTRGTALRRAQPDPAGYITTTDRR